MSRPALVIASLLLMGGGWSWQASSLSPPSSPTSPSPLPSPVEPAEPVPVGHGIPLTRIDLPASVAILTQASAEVVTAWWRKQRPDLVEELHFALSAWHPPTRPERFYAFARGDGSRVVLLTNHQGLVARCVFTADGVLSSCDRTAPEAGLPLRLPPEDSSAQRLEPLGARELAAYLLRVRDYQGSPWMGEVLGEEGEVEWKQDGDGWMRKVTAAGGRIAVLRLDANGALRDAYQYRVWRCGFRAAGVAVAPPPAAPAETENEPEPALPAANN